MIYRSIATLLGGILFLCAASLAQEKAVTQTKETQSQITPKQALEMLMQGNERFVENKLLTRNLQEQVKQTSKGQYPFAVVLGCIDSRVSNEIIFDQGIGDIFSARIAGNITDEDLIGSMEFGCKITGAKLILVLGHSDCGAVKGACDNVELGNLTYLLQKIKPAVDMTKTDGERNSKNKSFVEAVSKNNVLLAVRTIKDKSPVLKDMVDKGELMIVGAMYDVQTGKVTVYED